MIIDCTEYFRCRQGHIIIMQASPFGIGIEDWYNLANNIKFGKLFGFFFLVFVLVLYVIIYIILFIIILDQLAFTDEIILLDKANQRKTRTKSLGKKDNTTVTQKQPKRKENTSVPYHNQLFEMRSSKGLR